MIFMYLENRHMKNFMKNIHAQCVALLATLVSLFILTACGPCPEKDAEPINVAVSCEPMAEWAKTIGCDCVTVTLLVPRGDNPQFSKAPNIQELGLNKAPDKVFMAGRGLDEGIIDALKKAFPGKISPILFTRHMPKISVLTPEEGHVDNPELTPSPYIWLAPVPAQGVVLHIAQEMAKANPKLDRFFHDNAERYMREIRDLHLWIKQSLANINNREFVALHGRYIYYAYLFDLKIRGVIQPDPDKEPTKEHLQRLADIINTMPLKVIVNDGDPDNESCRQLAEMTGARVIYIPSYPNPDKENYKDYLTMMRLATTRLVDALK
jgi:ABC-type Zn uptake system ZnuABC Zn-binding protein ZnuA